MRSSNNLPKALLGIAIGFLVVRIGLNLLHAPSDQELIQSALAQSLQDSKNGRPGSALDLLSDQLTLNDASAPDQGQIAQFIRQYKPDITVLSQSALVNGDEARIVSPVKLSIGILGQSMQQVVPKVVLIFRREPSRTYLFLPSTAWKLAEVRVPQDALSHLSG